MNTKTFIDIHTHSLSSEPGVITVVNKFPDEEIHNSTDSNFYSVGLHPWHIKNFGQNNESIDNVRILAGFKQVCFVGECGLDKICKTDFEEQKRVFVAQIAISETFQKPLVIHCVRAFNEIIEIHNQIKPSMPWIMHGYNGNIEITRQLEKKNIFFSFGKSLFDVKSKSISSFKALPLNRIFFETDEYSSSIKDIYERGVELKNIELDKLLSEVNHSFIALLKRTPFVA